jgi:hypothetical protein
MKKGKATEEQRICHRYLVFDDPQKNEQKDKCSLLTFHFRNEDISTPFFFFGKEKDVVKMSR